MKLLVYLSVSIDYPSNRLQDLNDALISFEEHQLVALRNHPHYLFRLIEKISLTSMTSFSSLDG